MSTYPQKDHDVYPRERLLRFGPSALSDHELLAILFGSGTAGVNVFTLAAHVLSQVDAHGGVPELKHLCELRGMGLAKASALIAAFEFSRRRIRPEGQKIRGPEDILPLVQHILDRQQEVFLRITLNGAHEVISTRIVTIGLANLCQIHPREVFAEALTERACAMVVVHNHPSGDPHPSPEDRDVTKRLQSAADILGIRLLDHVIVSKRGFYSFSDDRVAWHPANIPEGSVRHAHILHSEPAASQ
jgi:DNA repair protein RadC